MTVASEYRDLFDLGGRRVTLERTAPNKDPERLPDVRVRIRGATPQELAGGILATERMVLVLAEDIPVEWRPLRKGDEILVDRLRLTFTARPDDQTHRDGETLLAYHGRASGA